MAIEIDIHMGFPILSPPNGSTTTEEYEPAEWFRWLLPSIRYYSPIVFASDHCSLLDISGQKQFQLDNGPLKCIHSAELDINSLGQMINARVGILNPFG